VSGLLSSRRTSGLAARWKIISTFLRACFTCVWFVQSPLISFTISDLQVKVSLRLLSEPAEKLSKIVVSQFLLVIDSQRWLPMNPAPPVISARIIRSRRGSFLWGN